MKRLLTICLVIMIFCMHGTMFSQTKFPVKLGLKVAPNIGWMSPNTKGYSSDGARLGGTIGFFGDYYFADNYAISTGFNFQSINGKLNYTDSLNIKGNKVLEEVSRKYNFLYLEIPLMIKMKTKAFGKMSYFAQVGLGTAFRLRASVKDNLVPATNDMGSPDNFNYGSTLIRESILVGIGGEYHIDESSRILIGISYSNSLNNILTGVNIYSNRNEKSLLNYTELFIGFQF